jgi:FMN phosphatase YigB (HAD superfamily)
MSKHYVLDFDGTLIDTDVYWKQVQKVFQVIGADPTKIIPTGEALFEKIYSVEQHARDLELPYDRVTEAIQKVNELVESGHPLLVFDDVKPFLLRTVDADKSVLTHGHPIYQKDRVQACQLGSSIGRILTSSQQRTKADHLEELMESVCVPTVFVDDDLHQLIKVHERKLLIDLVRMRRPGQRKSKDDHGLDHKAWRVIESFDELE